MFETKYIFRLNKDLTRDEVLEIVGKKFLENGIVNEGFIPAIKKREIEFPTGMVLENGTSTAISHTDDEYVKQDKIALVISEKPVVFKSIEDGKTDVSCNVFFVMALTKENKNDILVVITDLLENYEDKLSEFKNMTDEEIMNFLG